MPRFNIPQNRVDPATGQASPQAFGSGVGQAIAGVGQAVGDVAQVIQKKRERNDRLQLSIDNVDFRTSIDEELDSLKSQFPEGKGYSEAADKLISERFDQYLGDVDQKYRMDAEADLANFKARASTSARNIESSLFSNHLKVRIGDQVDRSRNRILSGNSNYDSELEVMNSIIANLPPEQQAGFRSSTVDALLSSKFQNSIDTFGYEETLKDYRAGEYDDMNPDIANQLIGRAKSKAVGDVKQNYSQMRSDIIAGRQSLVDPAKNAEIARSVGEPELAREFEKLAVIEDKAYQFARTPNANKAAIVSGLTEKANNIGLTPEETLELNAYNKQLAYQDSMFRTGRHWEYAQEVGVVPDDMTELPLIPMGDEGLDMDAFQEALDERMGYQDSFVKMFGALPPMLTDSEVSVVQAVLTDASPQVYSGYLNQISRALGPENLAATAQQIAPKDKRLVSDMALAAYDPELVKKNKMGMDKPVKQPSKDAWIQKFQDMGYYRSGMTSDVMNELLEQAKDNYAYRFGIKGESGDDDALMEASLKAVAGEIVRFKNEFTLPQMRDSDTGAWIDVDDIEDSWNKLNDKMIESLDINPGHDADEYSARILREQTHMVPVSATEFRLKDNRSLNFVYDLKTGLPVQLKMSDFVGAWKSSGDKNAWLPPTL